MASTAAVTSAKDLLRRAVTTPIGAATGAPRVHVASPLIRGGNFLYYWMWAAGMDSERRPARVQLQESIQDWLAEFPLAAQLTVAKGEVPLLRTEWVSGRRHRFGVDFDRSDVTSFSHRLIESSPRFLDRRERLRSLIDDGTIVINVRRGDYYQYEHLSSTYGLANELYVPAAVRLAAEAGRGSERFFLVSDDIPWCREHVSPALDGKVIIDDGRSGPFDDLAALSLARTSVITNSTFSFWGAFLAAATRNDHIGIAPPYHLRDEDGHRNREAFDPDWLTVELLTPVTHGSEA
ncbi:alpha-1,2-fucosyltransferase [Brachybacterium aquaticum]|uniref:Alpha-1,2-fucosyltransferase n=1 Tax=Brachybacterium aquaticum TaxID=1432564 RepID=A0A841AHH0_9MICO|nr:alpha-1,2-fucosyltransferase [Brachybacterium aquaticum]MBB5832775.1 hypothetical protein [Brachybacterium aquaticum]